MKTPATTGETPATTGETPAPTKIKPARPVRFRRSAKPYRLIQRKTTHYIAWQPRGGKQETTKEQDYAAARAYAYRRIAQTPPDLARELGIEITPLIKGL